MPFLCERGIGAVAEVIRRKKMTLDHVAIQEDPAPQVRETTPAVKIDWERCKVKYIVPSLFRLIAYRRIFPNERCPIESPPACFWKPLPHSNHGAGKTKFAATSTLQAPNGQRTDYDCKIWSPGPRVGAVLEKSITRQHAALVKRSTMSEQRLLISLQFAGVTNSLCRVQEVGYDPQPISPNRKFLIMPT